MAGQVSTLLILQCSPSHADVFLVFVISSDELCHVSLYKNTTLKERLRKNKAI
jgi:hypothetical protein